MRLCSLTTRALAIFVTAFVCLNGFGVACVAYCRTMDEPSVAGDYCPLKKAETTCGSGEQILAVSEAAIDCCPMTLSLIAAPYEKHKVSFEPAAEVDEIKAEHFRANFSFQRPFLSTVSYRGPPPRDRRPDRIKHQVLLI